MGERSYPTNTARAAYQIPPLRIPPSSSASEIAAAVMHLRRLANRHGCHEDHCPDPRLHDADWRAWRLAVDVLTSPVRLRKRNHKTAKAAS